MENASKALLIAGGILIAIILISLLVRTYGNIGNFQRQKMTEEEIAKIEEYNKEYTKYLGKYVYGTEVITAINRALNEKQTNNNDIKISIKFTVTTYEYTIQYYKNGKKQSPITKEIKKGGEFTLDTNDSIETFSQFINPRNENGTLNENVEQLKSKAFKCDKIDYDKKTGKVNYMHFTEMDYKIKDKEIWQ